MNTTTNIEGSLGMKRAQALATALCALGHDAEAFVQYGDRCAVGVDRVAYYTAGTWRHTVAFTSAGELMGFCGGGRGNPWRGGDEHDAVEAACLATFDQAVAG